ncbi:hypothetical protein [Pararhodobacter aggregans]|uniref:Fatty acid desaturase n=1 Tax=Pararhodobacter aggregans TaxID=404875 RepID=A0A2T7UNE4_9RHOB|nr:hypothetical protein [Pararhodobacter aggregans]PTW98851.1 hypothetical protein C8N33_12044 [Pararhodobacter aggregans]PVE46148.1 hypothetical protein DDE23_18340 [Pararhodobacter aggregans]
MASADIAVPNARRSFAYRLPILGAMAREWTDGDPDFPLYVILALVSIWGIAITLFGLPALYLPAVVAAPLMVVMLVLITRG